MYNCTWPRVIIYDRHYCYSCCNLVSKNFQRKVSTCWTWQVTSGNPLNMVVVILQKGTLYAMCVRCQLFWEKIGYSGRFCDLGRFGDSCRIGKVIKIVEAGGSALRPPYYCGVLIDRLCSGSNQNVIIGYPQSAPAVGLVFFTLLFKCWQTRLGR